MSFLFVSPARLTGGDEIAVKVFWEKVELVLEPLSLKSGFKASLERVKWLKNEGLVIPFRTLQHLELSTPQGEEVGLLTIHGNNETYRLVLPSLAARRVMGLWMAVRLEEAQ